MVRVENLCIREKQKHFGEVYLAWPWSPQTWSSQEAGSMLDGGGLTSEVLTPASQVPQPHGVQVPHR